MSPDQVAFRGLGVRRILARILRAFYFRPEQIQRALLKIHRLLDFKISKDRYIQEEVYMSRGDSTEPDVTSRGFNVWLIDRPLVLVIL
jgi:hypothetical protein